MAGDEAISQRAFAERTGLSRSYIGRLVKAKKLPSRKDGSIPKAAGLRALANLRETRTEKKSETTATAKASAKLKAELQQAQLRERIAKAKQRELEVEREAGRFVAVAEVEKDARKTAEEIRGRMLAIPARLALSLEALCAKGAPKAAALEALLADEINAVLAALQRSRFAGATKT